MATRPGSECNKNTKLFTWAASTILDWEEIQDQTAPDQKLGNMRPVL
jgi:hypothetical protein